MSQNRIIPKSEMGDSITYIQSQISKIKQDFLIKGKDFFDPSSNLPGYPVENDIYVASETGNGWIKNYIYTYDGVDWMETAPKDGYFLILSDINSTFLYINEDWQLQNFRYYDYGHTTNNGDTYTFDATKYSHYGISVNNNITIKPMNANYLSNTPYRVIFYIQGGGSHTITWGWEIMWANHSVPDLSSYNESIIAFTTIDGGNNWEGSLIGVDYFNDL